MEVKITVDNPNDDEHVDQLGLVLLARCATFLEESGNHRFWKLDVGDNVIIVRPRREINKEVASNG